MKASQLLRRTKVQQCQGAYQCDTGKYCAMGAIMHELGWKGKFTKTGRLRKVEPDNMPFMKKMLDGLGLRNLFGEILKWNDEEKLSFEEIAERLEDQGL